MTDIQAGIVAGETIHSIDRGFWRGVGQSPAEIDELFRLAASLT